MLCMKMRNSLFRKMCIAVAIADSRYARVDLVVFLLQVLFSEFRPLLNVQFVIECSSVYVCVCMCVEGFQYVQV